MLIRDHLQRLADGLLEIEAVRFGAFRLKLHETHPEAPLSPIYLDLRRLRSSPDLMDSAVEVLAHVVSQLRFDVLADVPTAATPFVAILAHTLRVPMVTPREPKGHGTGASIDGIVRPDQRVVVIDDLITRADSKLAAIRTLEDAKLTVLDVVVLVDREQGGREELASHGYTLHAAIRLSELLEGYRRDGRIDQATHDRVITYLRAPA